MSISLPISGDSRLKLRLKALLARDPAPLTPEEFARLSADIKEPSDSPMAHVARCRTILGAMKLSAGGGAVRRGERGDRTRPTEAERHQQVAREQVSSAKMSVADLAREVIDSVNRLDDDRHRAAVKEQCRAAGIRLSSADNVVEGTFERDGLQLPFLLNQAIDAKRDGDAAARGELSPEEAEELQRLLKLLAQKKDLRPEERALLRDGMSADPGTRRRLLERLRELLPQSREDFMMPPRATGREPGSMQGASGAERAAGVNV
jgi:hypothetical protein